MVVLDKSVVLPSEPRKIPLFEPSLMINDSGFASKTKLLLVPELFLKFSLAWVAKILIAEGHSVVR